jgi:tripartite ATP-independent transporter DctP family solute receptor
LTVLPGGALGDERANMQQLQNNSIDVAILSDLQIPAFAPPFKAMGIPFVYRDVDHVINVYNGEIGAELAKYLLENHNLHLITWQYIGTRELTANRPVHSLAEMKGLKLRLPGNATFISSFEPTQADIRDIAFTELQLALQTGTVEAQENPPNFIRAQKFHEVQDYLMLTDHYPQMQAFYLSDKAFKELTPEQLEIVIGAFKDTAAWTTEQAKQSQQDEIAWLTSSDGGGMELVEIDMTGILELIKDLPGQIGGEDGTKLFERIQAVN